MEILPLEDWKVGAEVAPPFRSFPGFLYLLIIKSRRTLKFYERFDLERKIVVCDHLNDQPVRNV